MERNRLFLGSSRAAGLPGQSGQPFSNELGLDIVENLRTGQPVAERLVLIELPDDFLVARDFKDLRTLLTRVAIANDEVAVVKFGEERRPLERDSGVGHGLFDFPDDLAIRRDFN